MSRLQAKKMKLDEGEFTEDEALKYCFAQIDRKTMESKKYNRLLEYRRRWRNKELGLKAAENTLIEFGFEIKDKVYVKTDKK